MRLAALCLAALAVADALSAPAAGTKAKRVLVPIADGTEEIEVVTVVDVLRRAGAEVVLASVEEEDRVVCSRGVKIEADCNIKAVTGRQGGKEGWDLIAVEPVWNSNLARPTPSTRRHPRNRTHWLMSTQIPGGMPGAERIRDSVRLHPALEKHWRAMRPLAMICATPAVLGEPKGFLEGVAATSHPAFIDEIGGSLEETQPYTEGRVVWDANIITSRGPGTALEWSLCCVEAIFGRAKALEVAGPMVTQPATLPPKRPFEWRLEEEVSSRVDRSLQKYAT
jgi:4-methyl-5(b-hydroxyethyl)-thiazole monophosphate biosynthesis